MKRYDPSLAAKKYDEIMIECVNGEWVRYEEAYRETIRVNSYLRQRVKELEDKAANMERLKFIWQNKAVERGERMKEMRDFIKKRGTFTHGLAKWFDPEGEPL